MLTLIMNGFFRAAQMSKWCVAAWICAVTLPLLLRSADKGSQVVAIVSTPAAAWHVIDCMRINVNQKFTVTAADCGVILVKKSHTLGSW